MNIKNAQKVRENVMVGKKKGAYVVYEWLRRMAGGGSFRYTKWDPFLILSQMSALQCIYYVSLGIWIFFFDVLSGTPRSLDQIFKYQTLLASSWIGNLQIAAFLFNALTW